MARALEEDAIRRAKDRIKAFLQDNDTQGLGDDHHATILSHPNAFRKQEGVETWGGATGVAQEGRARIWWQVEGEVKKPTPARSTWTCKFANGFPVTMHRCCCDRRRGRQRMPPPTLTLTLQPLQSPVPQSTAAGNVKVVDRAKGRGMIKLNLNETPKGSENHG